VRTPTRHDHVAPPTERALTSALIGHLSRQNDDGETLIASQRDICWREGRIDVIVVNGSLSGFEIKSGRDSLRRLPRQVDLFGRVLDYATLVCHERHTGHATDLLPDWWGLIVATAHSAGVEFDILRPPEPNPMVHPYELARMLHVDELIAELAIVRRLKGISTLRQADLAWLLADLTRPDEMRLLVRKRLRQRPSWRAAASRT